MKAKPKGAKGGRDGDGGDRGDPEGKFMNWCCAAIKNSFLEAGHRGVGFFVADSRSGTPTFVLQFRAIAVGSLPPDPCDSNITLVTDLTISYCPFCGKRLDRFCRNQLETLHKPELRIPL